MEGSGDGVGDVFIRDYIRKLHFRGAFRHRRVVDEKRQAAQPLILGVGGGQHRAQGFGAEGGCGAQDFFTRQMGEFAVVRRGGFADVGGGRKNFCAAADEFGAQGRRRGKNFSGNSAEDGDVFSGDILQEGEVEEILRIPRGRGGQRESGIQRIGGGLSDGEGGDGV